MDHPVETIQNSTQVQYQVKYQHLIRLILNRRMIQQEESDSMAIDALEMISYLSENTSNWRGSTLNSYRSALLYCLPLERPPSWQAAMIELNNSGFKNLWKQFPGSNDDHKRRPSRRIIPEEDLRILIDELIKGKGISSKAAVFLLATVGAGLRPIEWVCADWTDDFQTVLRVRSAKIKNQGIFRKVPAMFFSDMQDILGGDLDSSAEEEFERRRVYTARVDQLRKNVGLTDAEAHELLELTHVPVGKFMRDITIDANDRRVIHYHLLHVKTHLAQAFGENYRDTQSIEALEAKFHEFYRNSRKVIYMACKRVFGDKTYSLYDCRNVFAANRKAQYGVKAASEELGHGETASLGYYASGKNAYAGVSRRAGGDKAGMVHIQPDSKPKQSGSAPAVDVGQKEQGI